jgi:hypothetical protein
MSNFQKPDVPEPTTVHDLKAMLGVPDADELAVSQTAFPAKAQSARPVWKSPIAKLGLVGVALIPVFVVASTVLKEGKHLRLVKQPASSSTGATTTKPDKATELERLRQENAALKSKSALEGQAYVQARSTVMQRQRTSPNRPTPPAKPEMISPVAATSSPSISYRSVPPSIQANPVPRAYPNPVGAVATAPTPVTLPSEVDPVKQWQQLAQLGSYGAIAVPESLAPERAIATVKSVGNLTPADWTAADAPIAQVQTISTASERPRTAPENLPSEDLGTSQAIAESNSAMAEPPPAAEAADLNPPILAEAEATILQDPHPSTQALLAGTSSSGKLTTPVVLENIEGKNTFVVELDEPLIDSQGNVALPEGSKLLVQVDRLSENGFVELSATQAIWEVEGLKQQAILPTGVIQIRGKAGRPLVVQQHSGSDHFERDVTQFALGAIRRSAGLYTRSNTRVQTGDRTTVVTENNPEPNILAGALEGGTEAVLGSVSDRNQQAGDGRQRRPEVPYIKAGTPVQVFVNQSMELAM